MYARTFAQVLSRHGARDPTASKTKAYNATIQKIKSSVTNFPGKYAFLRNYTYSLGADQLTDLGRQELFNSGSKFHSRYSNLASNSTPFFRASGQARVIESAQYFADGFLSSSSDSSAAPLPILTIPETDGSNNTLNHGLCTAFESNSTASDSAQAGFAATFVPAITQRLNTDLSTTQLTDDDTLNLLDICAFQTVALPPASADNIDSNFCPLFTETEFHSYDYYLTLGKFYGNGGGNPLGPTQGAGFALELLSRLTSTPIDPTLSTSINHTLSDGSDNPTFPLNAKIYADFSHDSDIVSILFAMGLYSSLIQNPLSTTSVTPAEEADGFSSAYAVPFSGRVYVEKMICEDTATPEELVRIIVNDRVAIPSNCGVDGSGRCTLSSFVEAQRALVGTGGGWERCFA